MTQQQDSRTVEFLEPVRLSFVEAQFPCVSSEELAAVDGLWEEAGTANPSLFDGPAVACVGVERQGPGLVLAWARASYRYQLLRHIRGAGAWLPSSVYVAVLQPVDELGLVVGRSSPSTAAAGRWTLPGGLVEPPAEGEPLDLAGLRRHAARELAEEIGVHVGNQDLELWAVTRGEHGNVGVHFRAPRLPEPLVRKQFEAVTLAERARGVEPELEQLTTVRTREEVTALRSWADYLPQVVNRFASAPPSGLRGAGPMW
ncbi:NUDIX hydrolase [Streptomyces sp. NRRL F-4489]|uniref:NUDIX hydrolase n=1 Tax=Streptomyces sp. NRRL F-4489 TaxID=1609095 RepID=UPI00082EC12F|nr:NUDIX domain-containing protein [Streptomyces sp. NRRL F-4489]